MRWYILRTLLNKELMRHLADRGGLMLSLLLVAMSLLLSLGKASQQAGPLTPDLARVYVVFEPDDPAVAAIRPWVKSLKNGVPAELKPALDFRPFDQVPRFADGRLRQATAAAIIIHSSGAASSPDGWQYRVEFWYPGEDNGLLAPFEAWFWKETYRHFQGAPAITEERKHIEGSADIRSLIAAALVVFALFFTCIYLLPSMTCEERERGVLLAQALSPASPLEILTAKFLFYPVFGIGLSAVIAGVYSPRVLLTPFFWTVLVAASLGSLGIGLSVASLARTQRRASMGALCYMLVVALFLLICQQNNIGLLPWVALEYHTPRLIHAALADAVDFWNWVSLIGMSVLSLGWATLAVMLFRKRGWQ